MCTFGGIVIAQDGEDLYIVLRQLVQQPHVVQLGRQIVRRARIYVAADQHGVRFFINGQLHDFLERPHRRFAYDALPPAADSGDVVKGTAQM